MKNEEEQEPVRFASDQPRRSLAGLFFQVFPLGPKADSLPVTRSAYERVRNSPLFADLFEGWPEWSEFTRNLSFKTA